MKLEKRQMVPKQFYHWCQQMGLKPRWGFRAFKGGAGWAGHGRLWRVSFRGTFDMGSRHENFDRWSNSIERSRYFSDLQTFAQFKKFVESAKGVAK